MWNSGEYGFKDEAALYDNSFQPYGSIWIMNADGTGKRQLTDSHWEDAMPAFVPKTQLPLGGSNEGSTIRHNNSRYAPYDAIGF